MLAELIRIFFSIDFLTSVDWKIIEPYTCLWPCSDLAQPWLSSLGLSLKKKRV